MLQSLQEESHKAQQQKSEALSQLQAIDSSKQGLEEKVTELQRTNTQLQVAFRVFCDCYPGNWEEEEEWFSSQ